MWILGLNGTFSVLALVAGILPAELSHSPWPGALHTPYLYIYIIVQSIFYVGKGWGVKFFFVFNNFQSHELSGRTRRQTWSV